MQIKNHNTIQMLKDLKYTFKMLFHLNKEVKIYSENAKSFLASVDFLLNSLIKKYFTKSAKTSVESNFKYSEHILSKDTDFNELTF